MILHNSSDLMQKQVKVKQIYDLKGHTGAVTAIEAEHTVQEGRDSSMFVTASKDKSIITWKYNDPSQPSSNIWMKNKQLNGHLDSVTDLVLTTADKTYLLTSSNDHSLKLWNLDTGNQMACLEDGGHTNHVLSCDISPDNRVILSSGADKLIKIWNTIGVCKHTENWGHYGTVSKIRFIKGLELSFAAASSNGDLIIFSLVDLTEKRKIKLHNGKITTMHISSNGDYIGTGGEDKHVKICEIKSENSPVHDIYVGSTVNCVAVHPREKWVAIGTETGWLIQSFNSSGYGILWSTWAGEVTALAWSYLGNVLFVGLANGEARVISINA